MVNQQLFELAMWVGVIMASPLLFRFSYAASALLWRRVFPTRKFEFSYKDEHSQTIRSITILIPRNRSKTLVQLIDEAQKNGDRNSGK